MQTNYIYGTYNTVKSQQKFKYCHENPLTKDTRCHERVRQWKLHVREEETCDVGFGMTDLSNL